MNYYIAADGGGTKLSAILYDEAYHILKTARVSGTNANFRSAEDIAADADALVSELLSGLDISGITALDTSIVGDSRILFRALSSRIPVGIHREWPEGNTALGAAGLLYGCAAQAGTGSDAFLIQPDRSLAVGGYGTLLGDEGSGYDIGLRTLKAAIYAEDGRGPMTEILPILYEKWNISRTWALVSRLINDPDQRKTVASASYITELAADRGDPTAKEIFREAGHALALQVNTALKRYGKPITGSVVMSGGAWKGSPLMCESFYTNVHAQFPDVSVISPLFEPVVGCVILPYLSAGGAFSDLKPILMTEFSDYVLKRKEKTV